VTVTCLIAAVTYAGAVTTWALGVFVLPGVAGAALLASLLAVRRMPGIAIVVVGALVLGWGELANVWTGTENGPAARSTVFAAGWSLIAVVLAHSRWPALFLVGVAGVVDGALVLGAGGEVRVVAVAAAVSAALTLGWIERSRRNWTARPRRGFALVLLSLLAGAAAAGAVLLQAQKDPRHPELVAQGREYPGINPTWTDPLGTASKSLGGTAAQRRTNPKPKTAASHPKSHTPRHTSTPTAKHATPPHHRASARKHTRSRVWLYVLAGILLFLLAVALIIVARLLATRFAWRRVRRRLAAGEYADQVTGAWAWARLRLDACRLPLAVDASPDSVAGGRAAEDLPADVFTSLRELATATTTAAFAHDHSIGSGEVSAAWTAAGRADASARGHLTRRGRARLAFRGPVRKERTRS
jgi:hypothetical protein